MSAFAATRRNALAGFALAAAAFYALVHALFLRHGERLERDAILIALTIDLVLVVPACFYALVVRRLGWRRISLVPVVVASIVIAGILLPEDRQAPLHAFEWAIAPVEIGLLAWVFWKLARALRSPSRRGDVDALAAIRTELQRVAGSTRATELLATELALFWYAFASWRARPRFRDPAWSFAYHGNGGQIAATCALCFLLAVETAAVHLLVRRWSEWAAWLLSASSIYALIWLIAQARAAVLRPIRIDGQTLALRCGLRWAADVAIGDVERIETRRPEGAAIAAGFLCQPTLWIVLRRKTEFEGPYGLRRTADAIGIAPDDAKAFRRELEARLNT